MDFSMFDIYLIMTADSIHGFLIALSVGAGFLAAGRALYCLVSGKESDPFKPFLWGKYAVAGCLFFALVAVFMPTTRTLVAMYGITTVLEVSKDISQNENVNELGDKSFKALNHLLDSYINDQKNQQNQQNQ